MRKLRRRRLGSVTLTAGLFAAAGVGATGVMFSDRLSDLWNGRSLTEPSLAWMTLFQEKSAPAAAAKPTREAKVENAVLITPSAPALSQEPAASAQDAQRRQAAAFRALAAPRAAEPAPPVPATLTVPGSTASLSPAPRDLPWLPEAEKRAEALEPAPAPTPPRIALASPEVAPPIPHVSAPPAPSGPVAAEVAELIKRARNHIDLGDIAGARLLLERAASGNEPSALMALAETYDPSMLAKWGARLKADPAKARTLYLKAAERGLAEAKARMLALR